MPRPSEGRERIVASLKPEDSSSLAAIAIKLGYSRIYRGEVLPAWGELMEAIARRDLILYKKVERDA